MLRPPSGQYRMCTRCVMDTSDVEITFDAAGVCNHCHDFDERWSALIERRRSETWESVVERVRADGVSRRYDCVVGLSGGVDSSYLAYLAANAGLRVLAVHLDNGWNSELAVSNIHNLVTKLGLELHTHVIDWDEFRELQLAYFRAGVIDIEVLSDHAIIALMHRTAVDEGIGHILIGVNLATEAIMPRSWNYRKADLRNLKAIVRRNGGPRLKSFPTVSTSRLAYWRYVKNIILLDPLNLIDFDRDRASEVLARELGWRDYGGKHHESFFTRFYQGHVLPVKFGVDKRRAHLATMVCAGSISRQEALTVLDEPAYDPAALAHDRAYVVKKLGLSEAELDAILAKEPVAHTDYPSDGSYSRIALKLGPMISRRRARREARRGALPAHSAADS